jgi:uncharacterized protein (TIGR03435 family)
MIAECFKSNLNFGGKMMGNLAVTFVVALLLVSGLVNVSPLRAQSAAPATAPDITATWQGTLHAGQDLRTVLKVTKADSGGYKADFYSIDQGAQPIPVTKITLDGTTVKYNITAFDLKYEGKLSADGNTIEGSTTQGGNALPLTFTRATPATEWAIPKPPPPMPPMSADANPTFEVATIKPSVPNRQGKGFGFRDGHFVSFNTNLNDLISFAYGLHPKQVVGAPDWFGTDLFDIEGKPDTEGRPNHKQMGIMVQKLLTDRFKLTFHHDKRELSVYVISVASGGPKMTKSTAGPNDPQAFGFRGLGDLNVRNMTMADFASWMQNGVMDRPVVDQTGLTDRYDFPLKWTPDDSQFAAFRGVGAVVPPPTDDPKAPPALYTAIQEQLGLKMGPAKAPDDVIVIDHVEKPSAN